MLLCSDGLTNELGEQEIAEVLLDEPDAEKAAGELVRLALHRGGIDNVTVVVLDVLAGEAPAVNDDIVVIPRPRPAPGPRLGSRDSTDHRGSGAHADRECRGLGGDAEYGQCSRLRADARSALGRGRRSLQACRPEHRRPRHFGSPDGEDASRRADGLGGSGGPASGS